MTDISEERTDLTALREDAKRRATRITAGVMERVADARSHEASAYDLRAEVRRRLARLALPAALAAAASLAAVFLTSRAPAPRGDPFAFVVMGEGPATRWIVLDRRPAMRELVMMVRSQP